MKGSAAWSPLAVGRYVGITVAFWIGTAMAATGLLAATAGSSYAQRDAIWACLALVMLPVLGVTWRQLVLSLAVAAGLLACAWVLLNLADGAVALAGLIPVAEEGLFRGYLYGRLRPRIGVVPALLMTNLIFAAMHFSPHQMVRQLALGSVLTVLYELTGSLPMTVAAHVLHNLIVFSVR